MPMLNHLHTAVQRAKDAFHAYTNTMPWHATWSRHIHPERKVHAMFVEVAQPPQDGGGRCWLYTHHLTPTLCHIQVYRNLQTSPEVLYHKKYSKSQGKSLRLIIVLRELAHYVNHINILITKICTSLPCSFLLFLYRYCAISNVVRSCGSHCKWLYLHGHRVNQSLSATLTYTLIVLC